MITSWKIALEAAGTKAKGDHLPQPVDCPLCQSGRMWVYPDGLDNWWRLCQGCGQAGDLVSLVCQARRVEAGEALRLCQQAGMAMDEEDLAEEAVARWAHDSWQPRVRGQQLWEKASRDGLLRRSGYLQSLLSLLGCRYDGGASWNAEGIERLVGGLPHEEIELALSGPQFYRRQAGRGVAGRGARIFPGPGWGDVLVAPWQDVPGRVCGLTAVGRELVAETDFRYAALPVPRRHLDETEEAGLLLHPALWHESGRLVALGDWQLALRLAAKGLALRPAPLPIVAWRDGDGRRTRSAWRHLLAKEIVFAGQQLSPAMLRQALLADGSIAIFREEDLTDRRDPADAWRALQQGRQPWRQFWSGWLSEREPEEIERFLWTLSPTPSELTQLTGADLVPRAVSKLRRILAQKPRARSVTLDGAEIIERESGWFCRQKGREEQISDVALRIDRVVWREDQGQAWYEGALVWEGEEIPFAGPQEALDKDAFGFLQKKLLAEGKLLRHAKKWSRHATQIAMRLHRPQVEAEPHRVGWSDQAGALVTPCWELLVGGKVRPKLSTGGPRRPAASLAPPRELTNLERELLLRSQEGDRLTAAVLAAILANILAPAYGRPVRGVAVAGRRTHQIAERLAAAVGCLSLTGQEAIAESRRHDWPVFVESVTRRSLSGLLGRRDPPNVVLPVSRLQGDLLSLSGGWTVITDERLSKSRYQLSADTLTAWSAALPWLLKWHLGRQLPWSQKSGELSRRCGAQVAKVFLGAGKPSGALRSVLLPHGGYQGAPEEAVQRVLLEAARREPAPAAEHRRVYIPLVAVAELAHKALCRPPTGPQLVKALGQEHEPGILDRRGLACLSVLSTWWPKDKKGRFVNINDGKVW